MADLPKLVRSVPAAWQTDELTLDLNRLNSNESTSTFSSSMKPSPLEPLDEPVVASPSFTMSPASKVDMLIGSVANSLCAAGGFCAGSSVVVKHELRYPLALRFLHFAHPL